MKKIISNGLNRIKRGYNSPVPAPTSSPFLFVHIPKTAGTSFRAVMEESLNVVCDYGKDSDVTSSVISTHIYSDHDFYSLKNKILREKGQALSGHFHLHKYSDFVPVTDIVTFVREPLARVVSHFNHMVEHNGYGKSFDDYITTHVNPQTKSLNNTPVELLGVVGITECYNDSLSVVNHCLGTSFEPVVKNTQRTAHIKSDAITDEQLDVIKKNNQQDFELYKKAKALLEQRLALLSSGKDWTYLHAKVNANNALVGTAYFESSDKPVELDVLVNGQKVRTLKATGFFGQFPKLNFPRERYVGFNLPLKNALKATKGDTVEIRVCDTGQIYVVDRQGV